MNRRQEIAERLLAIGKEFAALPVVDTGHPDDMLCDDEGLPRE